MINNQLEKVLESAFTNAGFKNIETKILVSNRPELCDYQCDDCFKLAKIYRTSPQLIANKVVSALKKQSDINEYFSKIEFASPGFINLTLSNNFINIQLEKLMNDKNFGLKFANNEDLYFIDYGGANTAKPLHVGHLRSAILGESVKRIINFAGGKTITDVHLGDYGLQMGQIIYGLIEQNIKPDQINMQLLDALYPIMSAKCKADDELKEKCAEITKQLQENNPIYHEYWKEICNVSNKSILELYDYLGVKFDLWLGESHSYKFLPSLYEKFTKDGHLTKSNGADVIFVDKPDDPNPIPPLIFRKSNGAYLYGSTDMASVYDRVNQFNPSHLIYFADQRQSLHYEQFFRASQITNIVGRAKFEFCGFGTVNGTDGKPFKTRSGNSPKLQDMFEMVKSAITQSRTENINMSESDKDILANAIIKFADLQNNRSKDYIFDIAKFSNVVGKTGPYILYTYLRINKILNDESYRPSSNDTLSGNIHSISDKNLRLQLLTLERQYKLAYDERRPHYICDFLYETCTLTNAFYENNRIKEQDNHEIKQDWLYLLSLTARIIKSLLNLLMIEIPTIM